jgi:hypothetical protein
VPPSLEVDVEAAVRIIKSPGLGAEQDWAQARELFHLLRSIEHPDMDRQVRALERRETSLRP